MLEQYRPKIRIEHYPQQLDKAEYIKAPSPTLFLDDYEYQDDGNNNHLPQLASANN
jgi:hypothetical protein